MPKQVKSVNSFNRGIITNVSSTDIPDDACLLKIDVNNALTVNLDPNASGILIGLPKSEVKLTGLPSYNVAKIWGWIYKSDGTYTLMHDYSSGTAVKAIEDFYGTPSASTRVSAQPASMIIQNEEAHVSYQNKNRPDWIGYLYKGQFGYSVYSGLYIADQGLTHEEGSSAGNFNLHPLLVTHASSFDGSMYYWAYSLIYDGYQESPLYYAADLNQDPTSSQSVIIRFTGIAAYTNPSAFNRRISGARIYRSKSIDGTFPGREFFRLIKEIDIDDTTEVDSGTATSTSVGKLIQAGQNFLTTVSVGNLVFNSTDTTSANVISVDSNTQLTLSADIMASGESYTIYSGFGRSNATDLQFSFLDDGSISGASYEAQTGIAETLEVTHPYHYETSALVNGYHFVGNCLLPDDQIPDASHFILRSKRGRLNMFDWTKDFLRLPTIPVAMAGYEGKLFVWDDARTYIINPEGLFIEDILEGAGCKGNHTWVATDYGLFWADRNRAFRFLNNDLRTISDPIENIIGEIYAPDNVIFDAEYNFVMFYSTTVVMCYHVVRERWDIISPIEASVSGAFTGINGETYTAGGNKIVLNFKSGWVESGQTTSAATGKLIDGTQNFLTTVSSGMMVINTLDNASATVNSVDSNTQLTLSADIMGSGEYYQIYYPRRAWSYASPDFTFGEPGQEKKFYKAYIKKRGSVTESFALDGTGVATTIGTDDKLDISGEWARGRTIRLQLIGSENSSVDYYEILFRRLIKL